MRHVLVVAHRTAATPRLLDAVRERAQAGDVRFTLLVPADYWEQDTERGAAVVELAAPLLEEAVGDPVAAVVGDHDPLLAIEHALAADPADEILISTLPARVSHWLHRDLPAKAERFGVPVAVVTAQSREDRAPAT